MKDIEQMFYGTDFSKHTDLKSRLAKKLFSSGSGSSGKVTQFPFRALADDEVELVNAAQGIWTEDDKNKDQK